MKIIIDADGCPVTNLAIDIALENYLKVLVVSDTSHIFDFDSKKIQFKEYDYTFAFNSDDYITHIVADKGKDSSDFVIINKCNKKDIVITQDYALASMCLTKNCFVINQNGYVYTNENIDELLLRRHIGKKSGKYGKSSFRPKKRTKEQDEKFAINFKKLIKKAKKTFIYKKYIDEKDNILKFNIYNQIYCEYNEIKYTKNFLIEKFNANIIEKLNLYDIDGTWFEEYNVIIDNINYILNWHKDFNINIYPILQYNEIIKDLELKVNVIVNYLNSNLDKIYL